MRRTPRGSRSTSEAMALSVLNRKCGSSWRRSASRRASASWLVSWIACSRRARRRSEYARATPVATTPRARTSALKKPNQKPHAAGRVRHRPAASAPSRRNGVKGSRSSRPISPSSAADAIVTRAMISSPTQRSTSRAAALEIEAAHEGEQDRREDRPEQRLDRGDEDPPVMAAEVRPGRRSGSRG